MQIIDLQIKPVNNFNGIIVQVKYQLQGTKNNYKCLSLYLILIHAILFWIIFYLEHECVK